MSRRQEKTTGYVTINYQQPVCDLCRRDIPVGERHDDLWKGSDPVYKLTFARENNGIQGNSITLDLCSSCWNQHFVTLMRELGMDTGGVV